MTTGPELLGDGDIQEGVAMPDLVGMGIDRARRILAVMGLPGVRIRLTPIEKERDLVARQSPAAGNRLPSDPADVELWVESDNPDRLLPEIYREADTASEDMFGNPRSAGMLHRFLAIAQNVYSELEWFTDVSDRVFSPVEAPAHFLPFLESLFPYDVDPNWSIRRRREILLIMPELLRKRGTAQGLELMVWVYTGIRVKVHERGWPFKGQVLGDFALGDGPMVSRVPGDDEAFFIELPPEELPKDVVERIHRVVDAEKPAGLIYCLWSPRQDHVLERFESTVGVDFIIGKTPVAGDVKTPGAHIAAPQALPPELVPDEDWRWYTGSVNRLPGGRK